MKRRNPEQVLHRAVADYLRKVLRPPALFSTFPAGGGGAVRGAQLKAMGLRPGMPDILVFAPLIDATQGETIVLGIELKAAKGNPTRAQLDMAGQFAEFGGLYRFCRSIDDVEDALAEAGILTRAVHFVTKREAA